MATPSHLLCLLINRVIAINPPAVGEFNHTPDQTSSIRKFLLESPIVGTFIYNLRTHEKMIERRFASEYFAKPQLVSSKMIDAYFEASHMEHSHGKYLMASIDQSLLRMGLSYVDIFYHHCLDPETPLEETMGALAQAVHSGKALYAGVSNYDGENLEKACGILDDLKCPFVINQNRYSIFDRTVEQNGLKSTAARLNKGIIAFSPLAQGMLTDRYLNGIPGDSRVMTDGRFLSADAITEEKLEKVRALSEIAKERNQTLAEMALAWVLRDGIVSSVLVGASKPSQIVDNIKAIENISFTSDELERIDKISLT